MSSPSDSFVDWAKSNPVARLGFRGALGAVRGIAAAFPNVPSILLDQVAVRFPDLAQMGGLTMISNLYGNPAVSIPAGTVEGLPIGMQVVGAYGSDDALLEFGSEYERHFPWSHRWPDL